MSFELTSKKLLTSLFAALYFLLIFFTSTGSVSEAQEPPKSAHKFPPVILQLKWFHQFQFAGYYAAQHKGFFEEEGLDVTIKEGGPKVQVDKEVSSGRSDYGVLASELIEKKAQGQPLVLLAAFMQHSTRAIIVREDSGINAPADLVDKLLMINRNEDIEFMAMFTSEGIPLDRLNIISKDKSANGKFINGEIDGLNGSIGNQPFLFSRKGISVKIIRPISYGIDFYGDSLFTSDTELTNHPERVEAFRRAAIKGWEYAMSNTSEIIDLILAEYNPNKTIEALQFEADALRTLILPDLVAIGHVNPQRLERIAHTYARHGLVPKNYSLKGFIYDPLQAEIERKETFRKISHTAGAIFTAVSAILLLFIFILRRSVKTKTKELFQSEAKLKSVLETLPLGVWFTDEKGEILYGNPAGQKIWQGASYVGPDKFYEYKGWWKETGELISPDEWGISRAIKNKITSREEEIEIECFDGSHKIILNWSAPILDANGQISGAVAVNQDISDRVVLNEEMKIQRMLLDKSQEIAKLGSWHLDIKNNILTWSAEECKIFEKKYPSESKQTYESFLDAVHPDDREMVDKTYTEAIKNKHPYECIHRVLRSDGTVRIVREKSEDIVDQNGDTIHSFGFTHDITDQKTQEKEREDIIQQLRRSLDEIKLLRDILPICSVCKNIRNDEGYYEQIESYFHKYSGVDFSHTICPKCMKENFPEEYELLFPKAD